MKHIFFDLDRTLWDFDTNSKAALELMFEKNNLGDNMRSFQSFYTTYKKINGKLWSMYGKGNLTKDVLRVKRFEDTLKSFQINNRELAEKLAEEYVHTSPYQTNIFPGTIETLKELKANNHELHIITNGFKEIQAIKLKNSGIRDYFDIIVCSEEVGKNKPAPEVFQYATNLAKANPSDSLMIGDDYLVDIVGAERFGMKGILFDPHQSYRDGTHDWHINSLDKIPGMIPWIKKTTL
jgi:putative hydrolase of the HAD superfamily